MARNKKQKTSSRKAKPAAPEAEVVQVEGGGTGIDDGIVLSTTLLLAGAVVLVYLALGTYPG